MKFLPQPTPWLLPSQTAICGISGASFFSGFFCLLERVGLVAHVRAATCKCAYPACVSSDWFCRCILDNIQPTGRCHNFEHHPWNQSIFLVEFIWFSCFALPSLSNKTGFCPFFPALSQGPRTTWVWPYAYHANEQYWSQCVRWTFQWSPGAGWPGWSKATVCTVPNS